MAPHWMGWDKEKDGFCADLRFLFFIAFRRVENATQQVVAIKVLNLDTEEEDVSDIQREIATLSQLKNCDSQNITRYHGSFLNGTKLWIVMDYAAGGSIRSLVRQ